MNSILYRCFFLASALSMTVAGCGFTASPSNGSSNSSSGIQALGFQAASNIETDTGMSFDPQIAVQPNGGGGGSAIAVWLKLVDLDPYDNLPAVYHLLARRTTSGTWVTSDSACPFGNPDPTGSDGICLIDTGSRNYNASAPKISMDDNGDAIVVWEQNDGTAQRVYARRFSAGTWGSLQQLNDSGDFSTFNASAPAIAVEPDGGGSAMAVWSQYYQTDWTTSLNNGAPYDSVRSMAEYNGNLYAGMGDGGGDADVWVFNPGGKTWLLMQDFATYEKVTAMTVYSGKLFVGLAGTATGLAEVQAYDVTTNTWTQVSDATIRSATYTGMRSMAVFNGQLYIGLGATAAGGGDVFRCTLCDGTDWTNVANAATAAYEEAPAMAVYNGQLYVGLGNTASTDADVIRCTLCDGTDWTTVLNNGAPYDAVRSMAVHNGMLYVGLGDGSGDGDIMRCSTCSGGDWTTIFGTATTGDAGNVYEAVTSMVSYNGFLYFGLGTITAGDGDIKRCTLCDGTTAGDLTDSRVDAATYESVFSLVVYDNILYAGMGSTASTDGDIFRFSAGWQAMARRFSSGTWETSDTGVCPANSGANDGICLISGGSSVTPSSSPVVGMDASGRAIAAFIRLEPSTCVLAPTTTGLANLGTFTCYDTSIYVNQPVPQLGGGDRSV